MTTGCEASLRACNQHEVSRQDVDLSMSGGQGKTCRKAAGRRGWATFWVSWWYIRALGSLELG